MNKKMKLYVFGSINGIIAGLISGIYSGQITSNEIYLSLIYGLVLWPYVAKSLEFREYGRFSDGITVGAVVGFLVFVIGFALEFLFGANPTNLFDEISLFFYVIIIWSISGGLIASITKILNALPFSK